MEYNEVIDLLKSKANKKNALGMARFGINTKNALGISVVELRKIAKKIGRNHELAIKLWDSGIHEARLLACFIGESKKLIEKQMEDWVQDFNSWDICDQVCGNLFDKTEFAHKKVFEWTERKEEFVKRAGFALIATLSVHDKKSKDESFERFFPIIKKHCTDERNYVRKAVNWALRQIGKRNLYLNQRAIRVAKIIQKINSKTARWIANDAIRELESEKIQKRLVENTSKKLD
jgi:3-methyladenine DNA glycosylase AlkD